MTYKLYLRFEEEKSESGKTTIIYVYSVSGGKLLARISWFSRWRQYTFFPEPDTVWNSNCLKEINNKIKELMDQRK